MKAYVIWNPTAGQADVRRPLEEALETLEAAGWSISLWETTRPGDGTRLAQMAVQDRARAVVAAGGDGTVNEVANGLAGTSVAMGVLPVGTGNVWAKALGHPTLVPPFSRPLQEAAQGLLQASVRTIDLGRANGRYFVLWAGVGFDAEVAHEVEPLVEMRHRLGNVLYAVSGLSMAFSFAGSRSTLVVDGRFSRPRVIMVVISNVPLYGAGFFQLAPAASLDDGCLDVIVFRGHGTADTFRHFFSLLTRNHLRDPSVSFYRARRAEIYPDRPMSVQVDGDAYGATPLSVEVVPRALRVLVPPTAPASLFGEDARQPAMSGRGFECA